MGTEVFLCGFDGRVACRGTVTLETQWPAEAVQRLRGGTVVEKYRDEEVVHNNG